MDLKNDLIKQIASDLKIQKFEEEDQESYLNRVLYSAIAAWTIKSTCDEKVGDNYDKIGVSKSYITRKISKIVCEFTTIFPHFRNFLDGLTESELVACIREYYEIAGYIVSSGFDEFVIVSKPKSVRLDKSLILLRNTVESYESRAIGLGMFSKKSSGNYFCSLDELFFLPKIDAEKWTKEYVKRLKWQDASKLGEKTSFFDPKKISNLSECWIEEFPDMCDITLYRVNSWDYGFAKKINTDIFGVKIPDWLIGYQGIEGEKLFNNDVRRFMYGLKSIYNNKAKSIAYKKREHYELKLLNALPTREAIALQFFAWKKKGFRDEYNYIVPNELFDTVSNLLGKLLIEIEVR